MGQVVTVFGGTGFLGRRVVRYLRDKGFSVRIASRHPRSSSGNDREVQPVAADIRERPSIAKAIEGAFSVVNAVSLYVERGTKTFPSVHVAAAERLAEEARDAGVERLIQISALGAILTLHPCARAGRASGPRGNSQFWADPAGG